MKFWKRILRNRVLICGAKSPTDFIDSSRPFLECAGISGDQVKEFSDTVFETFHDFKPSSDTLRKDYSTKILHMLRNSLGPVKDLLSAIVVVSPDSRTVERSVSTYNILYSKLRSSTNQNTVRSRLLIAWDGVATSKFDPRPVIGRFFQKKDRHDSRSTLETYQNREFVAKFF